MPVITISRGTFSGGKGLAECLAAKLDLECVSREVLAETAEEHGVPISEMTAALERPPSFLQRLSWDRRRYLAWLRATLCRHAESERMVYHGHGGHFLLEGISHVVRVLVIADMEYRIASAMERQGLSRRAAVSYIRKMDDQRRKWSKFLYGKEWQDPHHFDLRHMSVEEACRVVRGAAKQPSFRPTDGSRQAVRDLRLAAEAEAALLGDRRTRLRKLGVSARDGVVKVRGMAFNPSEKDAVREVLAGVEGVRDVETEIGLSVDV